MVFTISEANLKMPNDGSFVTAKMSDDEGERRDQTTYAF
jgi:hypothetical protein